MYILFAKQNNNRENDNFKSKDQQKKRLHWKFCQKDAHLMQKRVLFFSIKKICVSRFSNFVCSIFAFKKLIRSFSAQFFVSFFPFARNIQKNRFCSQPVNLNAGKTHRAKFSKKHEKNQFSLYATKRIKRTVQLCEMVFSIDSYSLRVTSQILTRHKRTAQNEK